MATAKSLYVVTGVSGLGFETARALVHSGQSVVLAGRNPAKGEASRKALLAKNASADVTFESLDLASLKSIRDFAARLAAKHGKIDVLINNAGVMAPPKRRETEDGFELQIGTNHLGHFALTGLLLPLLKAASAARVVTVSSLAHRNATINFDDLQSKSSYTPTRAYGQSKLANLLFAFELQRQSDTQGWGIRSMGVHPGVSRTELAANGPGRASLAGIVFGVLGPILLQSAAEGARPTLYAATSPDAKPAGYYGPSGFREMRGAPAPAEAMPQARDEASAKRLWDISERLTGVTFP